MPSVIVVDDDELVRRGLCDWLCTLDGIQVVGEAGSALECVTLVKNTRPDIALVDIVLPGISGIKLVEQLRELDPKLKCLMLSGSLSPELVFDAFAAGACGFLGKLTSIGQVREALLQVAQSNWVLDPAVTEIVVKRAVALRAEVSSYASRERAEVLSPQERELLKLIAEGYSFAEIAQQLSISSRSVERLKAKLEAKLETTSLVELVRSAIKLGLVRA